MEFLLIIEGTFTNYRWSFSTNEGVLPTIARSFIVFTDSQKNQAVTAHGLNDR